jgi:hypothetical protein
MWNPDDISAISTCDADAQRVDELCNDDDDDIVVVRVEESLKADLFTNELNRKLKIL